MLKEYGACHLYNADKKKKNAIASLIYEDVQSYYRGIIQFTLFNEYNLHYSMNKENDKHNDFHL